MSSSRSSPSSVPQRFVKEGHGWRIGWNDTASTYQGLLGGAGWAVELTAVEFQDFCRLAQELAETMRSIAPELMDQERINCEAESDVLWLEAEGFPHRYNLRFILTTGRQCEGGWDADVVEELMAALAGITLF